MLTDAWAREQMLFPVPCLNRVVRNSCWWGLVTALPNPVPFAPRHQVGRGGGRQAVWLLAEIGRSWKEKGKNKGRTMERLWRLDEGKGLIKERFPPLEGRERKNEDGKRREKGGR